MEAVLAAAVPSAPRLRWIRPARLLGQPPGLGPAPLRAGFQWWAWKNADGGGVVVQRMAACRSEKAPRRGRHALVLRRLLRAEGLALGPWCALASRSYSLSRRT